MAAKCSGVAPLLVVAAFTVAPASTRAATTSGRAAFAAMCSGV